MAWTSSVVGAALLLGACGPAAVDTIRPGGHRTAVGLHVGATWTLGLAALGADRVVVPRTEVVLGEADVWRPTVG